MTTYDNGDDNISPPEITTSQAEERPERNDITNELYMPQSSTIVPKLKKEMLYVPLDFQNDLTIDSLVDSGAYVGAIAQKELDRNKQQAPSKILKIEEPPNFQIQVAYGQFEKPKHQPHSGLTLEITSWQNRYYTWPHPFPTFDIASQECIELNDC